MSLKYSNDFVQTIVINAIRIDTMRDNISQLQSCNTNGAS